MTLTWQRATPDFEYKTYNRDHKWTFDGGHEMEASAAPAYLGNPALVDPEESFVAALASCHMLTFLAAACKKKFLLEEYVDEAVGHLGKNAEGKMAITKVELHPKLKFSGENQPQRRGHRGDASLCPRELFHRKLGQNRGVGGGCEVERLKSSVLRRFGGSLCG